MTSLKMVTLVAVGLMWIGGVSVANTAPQINSSDIEQSYQKFQQDQNVLQRKCPPFC